MVVSFANSHCYPGCQAVLRDEGEAAECLAEFSDGSVAQALAQPHAQGLILTIMPYVTRRGTRIPERTWLLTNQGRAGRFVARRVPPRDRMANAGNC